MQNYIKSNDEQIQQFMALALDGPIQMLNQIKFKPEGGAEIYQEYFKNTRPVLEAVGGKMIFHAQGRQTVIGGEEWDLVFIIEFPAKEAFFAMVSNETEKNSGINASAVISIAAPSRLDSRVDTPG